MTDTRDWQQARRARTRLLIEYGGMVVKAGLVELLEDDRATLLGGLLSLRDQLNGLAEEEDVSHATLKVRWRRRGLNALDADADTERGLAGDSSKDNRKGDEQKEGDREGGEQGAV
jgi:hypothetical protein